MLRGSVVEYKLIVLYLNVKILLQQLSGTYYF